MIVGKRKRATAPFKNGSVAVNKRRYAIADKRQTNTLDDSSDNDSDETFHPNDSNASVASDASTPKTKVLYRQRYPKGPELAVQVQHGVDELADNLGVRRNKLDSRSKTLTTAI
ncbi:hypothetical protein DVH05_000744 [Phytophthora capsici]|nr:hypothetical protein DVH05_000744 [Phytophthora capsici]